MSIYFYALVVVFVVTVVIFIFMIKNLLKQVEFYEDEQLTLLEEVTSLQNGLVTFKTRLENADNALSVVDRRGAFASDDEVGVAFSSIKSIVADLNSLIIEYNNDGSKENEKKEK